MLGEGFGVNMARWAGGEGLGGAGMFYWGTLAWISLTGQFIALHVHRHPELRDPSVQPVASHPWRGAIFSAAFLIFGVTSLFLPIVSSWLPLLIIPLSIWLGRRTT